MTWVLILTGVGLNAAAQLLLKVATRPLAHFTVFNADTLGSSVGDSVQEPAVLERHAVLRGQRLRVARGPVQGAGEHRLSHAVLGLCGGGRRLGGVAGRDADAGQDAGIALICAGVVLVSRDAGLSRVHSVDAM